MSSKKAFYKNYFQKYFVTTENNRSLKVYKLKLTRKRSKIKKLTKKNIEYMQFETV